MKKRMIFILLLLAVVAAVLFWRFSPGSRTIAPSSREISSNSSATSPVGESTTKPGQAASAGQPQGVQPPVDKLSALREVFNSPLSLYGKVLDQSGTPIPGVVVKVRVADKPLSDGSSDQKITDRDGLFEVTGVKGAGIYAEATKEGYYSGNESRRLLQSGEMPKKDSPLVLRLFKKGDSQNLIRYTFSNHDVPLDGTPIEYDFTAKKFVSGDQGQLRVQVWTEGSMQQHFSWKYQISLPSGGFVSRGSEFDFTAPSEGFTETLKGSIDAKDLNWRGSFNGDYFMRLPDGKFGRIKFSLSRGRDSFNFRIEQAAINPSGERNLE